MMSTLGWEIRHALRAIWRERAVCAVIILVFGLGIGANATVFSVVQAVLLRPLPFHEPDRLVWVSNQYPGSDPSALSTVTSRVDVFEEWPRPGDRVRRDDRLQRVLRIRQLHLGGSRSGSSASGWRTTFSTCSASSWRWVGRSRASRPD